MGANNVNSVAKVSENHFVSAPNYALLQEHFLTRRFSDRQNLRWTFTPAHPESTPLFVSLTCS